MFFFRLCTVFVSLNASFKVIKGREKNKEKIQFELHEDSLYVTLPTIGDFIYRLFQKKLASPPKTFWNIFTSVKSFCVKFCMQTLREQGLGEKAIISSYPDKEWKLSTV